MDEAHLKIMAEMVNTIVEMAYGLGSKDFVKVLNVALTVSVDEKKLSRRDLHDIAENIVVLATLQNIVPF